MGNLGLFELVYTTKIVETTITIIADRPYGKYFVKIDNKVAFIHLPKAV